MKLVTTIIPRRDGTVILTAADQRITFAPDASGELVAEVPDTLVGHLLRLGSFEPADEADFDAAEALMGAAAAPGGDDDEGKDDEDGNPDAPPVEAKTPPKASAPKPKGGTARAKRAH